MGNNVPPLLWLLTGSIGDALMALDLCQEIAECNPGVTSILLVRKNPQLVKDLARCVASVHVESASFTPRSVFFISTLLVRRLQIMSAWKSEGNLRGTLRALFLLNPETRLVRFDIHQPASSRDVVAHYDMTQLVIDNFRVLAQTIGLKTHPVGARASLPIETNETKLPKTSYLVLHPFGSNARKSLPVERAIELLTAHATAFPNLSFVVTGSREDARPVGQIVASVPRACAAIGLPILEVAYLIENAALYIGVDTGITHLAAIMGKKMLALEHPTHPRWFPTYNPNTVMFFTDETDTREGVYGISTDAVVAATQAAL